MIFTRENGITVITQEKATIVDLVKALEEKYDTMKNDHIVVNLFSLKEISPKDLNEFLRISKEHKTSQHSFVIVNDTISYEETPENITLVPSLREAYDIIEMEEIERDLEI